AAPLGRDVLQLEVLDVDPLGAEGLRDSREDSGPVGDVDADAMERAWVVVRVGEHPAAVAGGLADPAREEARVAGGERVLELLEPAAVLDQRAAQLVGVVEEDVDPD